MEEDGREMIISLAGVVQTELQTSVEGLMRLGAEDALRGHWDCDSIGMLSLYQL
jgi:hypothetical protein